jgi:pimeloyl-ACP methyl ester carboxylesterase
MALAAQSVGDASVRVWSEGAGPALLYLHGFERHPGEAPFLARLAKGRRVVAPEHPGYGESTGFEAIHDIVDVVLHYRRLVESLGLGQVDVVGHCLGGMFAAEFAALCPHLVRRLVLVGAYGLWRDDVPVPDPFAIEPADLQKAKWGPNPPLDPEPSIPIPEAENPHAAMFDRARNLAAATKFLWPIPDRGLRRRLPFVQAPTLVIQGADDGLVPAAYADEFARLIPDAKVRLFASCGHYPIFEREDEFVAAVESFLA